MAPTKFVAKLGSTRAKPDGLLVVPADRVLEFLHPLPVDALWGVGERAAETLRRLGLTTVGDLAEAPLGHAPHGGRRGVRGATCTSWPGGATRAGSARSTWRSRSAPR